jgi:D-3-phosphoglycerate dehydrogenase / 2-oxoglutarate reductase
LEKVRKRKAALDIKTCRVLVTATSYGKNDLLLRTFLEEQVGQVIYNQTGKALNAEQLAKLLPGMDGMIAGLDSIDSRALNNADQLKVISRYGVGTDNVDLEFARQKNIIVTNTPGANSVSVAELTIGLILMLARQIQRADQLTRQGGWPRLSGLSIQGKTVGILGLGSIGKQVVRRLAGFDCRILAYEPFPDKAFTSQYGVTLLPLDELLPDSDFICLHLPLLPETTGLVDAAFLAKMKRGAYLINTARGEIVDENALYQALLTGRIAGAALDAFTKEPPEPENPLLTLPNVIVTPHMGAHSDGATNAMGWMAMQDCLAVLRGEEPKYRVG